MFLTNKMRQLKRNKTDHKTHYMLDVNFYMFRHLIWSVFYDVSFYFDQRILLVKNKEYKC